MTKHLSISPKAALLLAGSALAVIPHPAMAQDVLNWDGAGSADFGDADNGQEGALPTLVAIDAPALQGSSLLVEVMDPAPDFVFWDGDGSSANRQIDGGSGTWTATGTNWTVLDGSANGAYDPADVLIFRGPSEPPRETFVRTLLAVQPSASAGTVTIDNSAGAVTLANGVQFAISGYTITGGALGLQAGDIGFGVGDGSKVGADFSATIASAITGAGRLVKDDFGTLILTGANTYSGGTTVAGGLLQGDAASLQGAIRVETEGALLFDQAGNGTYAGQLTGSGTVGKEGAGTLVLAGNSSSFFGETQVTGGTLLVEGTLGGAFSSLSVSNGATLGGSGTVGGSATLADAILAPGSSPGTLTIDGDLTLTAASILNFELGAPIGGTGGASDLVEVGDNLVLDGTLNVTAGTGFGAGLYRLFNYESNLTDNGLVFGTMPGSPAGASYAIDTASSGQVNLLVSAPDFAFIFWDGGQVQANGLIDGGSGTWSVANTNWTTPEGNNNGAFDPADFLIFRAPEQDQSATVRTLAAVSPSASTGTVTVDNSGGQVTIGNGVQFAATGYTVIGGAIRLTGPQQSVVRVGDGTEQGAAFVATIESVLTGTSGLAKTDLGTLILSGANTYSGGTLVEAGTLQGNATSLQGEIVIAEPGTVLFNQVANGTFAGTILGDGQVLKEGAGTLSLTGSSAPYNGLVRLVEGGINLSGDIGGQMVTLAGTRLSGTGRTEDLDLSGTIAPGNSIGSFDVNGELVFRAGSTYEVELAANGTGDFILADDTVTIEGGTVAISLLDPETSYVDGTSWTIIEGEEGITGTFAGLTENSAFLDFALGYTADTVFVTLDLVRRFPDVALTFNQRQASTALASLSQASGSDALGVYNALLMLDGDAARAAFDMSSGEIYADVMVSGLRAARERLAARQLDGLSRGEEGWQLWLAGGLGRGHVAGDGNGARFSRHGHELEFGADYHGPDNAYAFGVSGGWSWSTVANPARGSAADLDGSVMSAFARVGDYGDGLTAAVAGSYTTAKGQVARVIAFPGVTRTATSDVASSTRALAFDLRYGLGFGQLAIGPSAGLDYARGGIGSYAESGAGALNLNGAGSHDGATRLSFGGFASWTSDQGSVVLDARYVDGQADDSRIEHTMAGSPTRFAVLPARGSVNGARMTGAAEFSLGRGLSVGAKAAAFLAGEESEVSARAVVRMAF